MYLLLTDFTLHVDILGRNVGIGSRLDYKSQVTTSLSLLSIKSLENCIGNVHKKIQTCIMEVKV